MDRLFNIWVDFFASHSFKYGKEEPTTVHGWNREDIYHCQNKTNKSHCLYQKPNTARPSYTNKSSQKGSNSYRPTYVRRDWLGGSFSKSLRKKGCYCLTLIVKHID